MNIDKKATSITFLFLIFKSSLISSGCALIAFIIIKIALLIIGGLLTAGGLKGIGIFIADGSDLLSGFGSIIVVGFTTAKVFNQLATKIIIPNLKQFRKIYWISTGLTSLILISVFNIFIRLFEEDAPSLFSWITIVANIFLMSILWVISSVIALHKDESLIEQIILGNGDVNERYKNGDTALIRAAHNGNERQIVSLLNLGADLYARNEDGNTALLSLAGLGSIKLFKLLLEKGADINDKDNKDNTVLMKAAEVGNLSVVEELLKKKIDTTLKNQDGKTALMLAQNLSHKEIVALLQQHEKESSNN